MRSRVISALSRPRATSRRSVFMLTGMTSCTIGSTKAPPFMTTFWPARRVRTKALSFDERRYSQLNSQTTIATTMATTISPRTKVPNWAPLMASSRLSPDLLELTRGFDERLLGRQAFHARGSVEAVAFGALRQDEARIVGRGDRPAVAQHDDALVDLARRRRPGPDER